MPRAIACLAARRKAIANPWFNTDKRPIGGGTGLDRFYWGMGKPHEGLMVIAYRS